MVLAATALLAQKSPPPARIREASGVVRQGSHLLVVDDSDVGAYYRVHWKKPESPVIDLNAQKPERVRLKSRNLGVDLESIDLMNDGRVALLSERLRSLVSDDGVIAEYDSELAETGKRGLEGVAIRELDGGASQVAVLWEGGYPDFGLIAPTRQRSVFKPLVVVHDVPRNGKVGRVRLKDAPRTIELDVPQPAGEEPRAQRFRAPDLRWYPFREGGTAKWGFVVLLSSQNGLAQPEFQYKWLQRFDLDGKRVGEPLDLSRHFPPELMRANWEGLAWMEFGRSMILVHEEDPGLPPHAFLLELPPDWAF